MWTMGPCRYTNSPKNFFKLNFKDCLEKIRRNRDSFAISRKLETRNRAGRAGFLRHGLEGQTQPKPMVYGPKGWPMSAHTDGGEHLIKWWAMWTPHLVQ